MFCFQDDTMEQEMQKTEGQSVKTRETVYIIGHKNPDTDSICSAIAYAELKRRTEDRDFRACRAGDINEET